MHGVFVKGESRMKCSSLLNMGGHTDGQRRSCHLPETLAAHAAELFHIHSRSSDLKMASWLFGLHPLDKARFIGHIHRIGGNGRMQRLAAQAKCGPSLSGVQRMFSGKTIVNKHIPINREAEASARSELQISPCNATVLKRLGPYMQHTGNEWTMVIHETQRQLQDEADAMPNRPMNEPLPLTHPMLSPQVMGISQRQSLPGFMQPRCDPISIGNSAALQRKGSFIGPEINNYMNESMKANNLEELPGFINLINLVKKYCIIPQDDMRYNWQLWWLDKILFNCVQIEKDKNCKKAHPVVNQLANLVQFEKNEVIQQRAKNFPSTSNELILLIEEAFKMYRMPPFEEKDLHSLMHKADDEPPDEKRSISKNPNPEFSKLIKEFSKNLKISFNIPKMGGLKIDESAPYVIDEFKKPNYIKSGFIHFAKKDKAKKIEDKVWRDSILLNVKPEHANTVMFWILHNIMNNKEYKAIAKMNLGLIYNIYNCANGIEIYTRSKEMSEDIINDIIEYQAKNESHFGNGVPRLAESWGKGISRRAIPTAKVSHESSISGRCMDSGQLKALIIFNWIDKFPIGKSSPISDKDLPHFLSVEISKTLLEYGINPENPSENYK